MNILHIIPSLQTGGAERLALDICIALQNRSGINVKLFVFKNFIHFNVPSFVHIIPSSVSLSISKKNNLNVSLLQKEISKFKPDIIHTHLFEADLVARHVNYPSAKWFSHLHDNMPQLKTFSINTLFNKKLITNLYEKYILKKLIKKNGGNHFICISNDTLGFIGRVLSTSNHTLLYNAIDFNKFYNKKNYTENNSLELINIGSFQAKKNQKFLIEIVKVLKEKNIDIHLTLLGDGVLKNSVKQYCISLGLQDKITFKGNVQNVEENLKKSDIYLHSAYYEPFGLVLLEAMASGLPVITLDGKGNRDIIEEGKNGYMIFEQNAEKFVDVIINLWDNKKKMNEISKYANDYAKKFDIKSYVYNLLLLYKQSQ